MKTMIRGSVMVAVAGLAFLLPSPAPWGAQPGTDEAGIRAAALNYMDGALTADADRVSLGVHPELNKVRRLQLDREGEQVLFKAGATRLREATRGMTRPQEEWETEVTIFQTGEGLAQARAVSPWFYDLLQLVKMDGDWRIVNVLWEMNRLQDGSPFPEAAREAEEPGVRKAALDYIDGFFSGDPDRMARALSPQLNKVMLATIRSTGGQFLDYSSRPLLIEATRMGSGSLPEEDREIEMEVHDISHGLASVSITSSQFIDHVHLAKLNGDWKVVNVLWVPNPANS